MQFLTQSKSRNGEISTINMQYYLVADIAVKAMGHKTFRQWVVHLTFTADCKGIGWESQHISSSRTHVVLYPHFACDLQIILINRAI